MAKAITNRKICGDGEFTKRCQAELTRLTGTCGALLTTSGTSALELAAILLDIKLILMTIRILFSKESTEGFEKQQENEQRLQEMLQEMHEEEHTGSGV